jgi:hypothetical protein
MDPAASAPKSSPRQKQSTPNDVLDTADQNDGGKHGGAHALQGSLEERLDSLELLSKDAGTAHLADRLAKMEAAVDGDDGTSSGEAEISMPPPPNEPAPPLDEPSSPASPPEAAHRSPQTVDGRRSVPREASMPPPPDEKPSPAGPSLENPSSPASLPKGHRGQIWRRNAAPRETPGLRGGVVARGPQANAAATVIQAHARRKSATALVHGLKKQANPNSEATGGSATYMLLTCGDGRNMESHTDRTYFRVQYGRQRLQSKPVRRVEDMRHTYIVDCSEEYGTSQKVMVSVHLRKTGGMDPCIGRNIVLVPAKLRPCEMYHVWLPLDRSEIAVRHFDTDLERLDADGDGEISAVEAAAGAGRARGGASECGTVRPPDDGRTPRRRPRRRKGERSAAEDARDEIGAGEDDGAGGAGDLTLRVRAPPPDRGMLPPAGAKALHFQCSVVNLEWLAADRAERRRLKRRVGEVEKERDAALARVEPLQKEIEQQKSDLLRAREALVRARDALVAADARYRRLQRRAKSVESSMDDYNASLRGQVDLLQRRSPRSPRMLSPRLLSPRRRSPRLRARAGLGEASKALGARANAAPPRQPSPPATDGTGPPGPAPEAAQRSEAAPRSPTASAEAPGAAAEVRTSAPSAGAVRLGALATLLDGRRSFSPRGVSGRSQSPVRAPS